MVKIYKGFKVISQGKNLAILKRYATNVSPIDHVAIGKSMGDAIMSVYFADGAQSNVAFADYSVLKSHFLRNWRQAYGVPLYVNGVAKGTVSHSNPELQP